MDATEDNTSISCHTKDIFPLCDNIRTTINDGNGGLEHRYFDEAMVINYLFPSMTYVD